MEVDNEENQTFSETEEVAEELSDAEQNSQEDNDVEDVESLKKQIHKLNKKLHSSKKELRHTKKKLEKVERKYEKSLKYNDELLEQIKTLSQEVHDSRTARKRLKDVDVQVGSTSTSQNYDGYSYQHQSSLEAVPEKNEEEPLSLAESLKKAAEDAIQQTGYVYDDSTGLYYDYNTGYYYNAEKGLYYDTTSGSYFYYDEKTGVYKYHSQISTEKYNFIQHQLQAKNNQHKTEEEKDKAPKKKRKKNDKTSENDSKNTKKTSDNSDKIGNSKSAKQKGSIRNGQKDELKEVDETDKKPSIKDEDIFVDLTTDEKSNDELPPVGERGNSDNEIEMETCDNDNDDDDDVEEGEISDSSGSNSHETDDGEDNDEVDEDIAESYIPCIRAMVKSSESLPEGSLHIITCKGGSIGREPGLGHSVQISETAVSKMHAEVTYNNQLKRYTIVDFASQNGTFVNDKRIGESKVKSDPQTLFHNDELKIGSTVFDLHIHPGSTTCDSCEPGIIMAQIQQAQAEKQRSSQIVLGKDEKEKLRRQKFKQIKKKFGLENADYIVSGFAKGYQDKAAERRKTVGSDNPYQRDDAPASVDQAISTKNKGHKMLEKMGWKEGQTLGKSQKGIKEPIKVNIRTNATAGLGSATAHQVSLDNTMDVKRSEILIKTQKRFAAIDNEPDAKALKPDGSGWVGGGTVQPNLEEHQS